MLIVLLAFAFVFFVVGTFTSYVGTNPWYGRFNWISAGLAVWVLVDLLAATGSLHK
jgi:hypothetical protein